MGSEMGHEQARCCVQARSERIKEGEPRLCVCGSDTPAVSMRLTQVHWPALGQLGLLAAAMSAPLSGDELQTCTNSS